MAVAQLLYLVLFSATFFWKGYTGLAITAGAIDYLDWIRAETAPSAREST